MLLCEMFNRQLSDLAMETWVDNLTSLYGPHLFEALDAANRAVRMPSLGEVIQDALARRRRADHRQVWLDNEVPPEQRQRNEEAARRFFEEMRQRGIIPLVETDRTRGRVQRSALRRHL